MSLTQTKKHARRVPQSVHKMTLYARRKLRLAGLVAHEMRYIRCIQCLPNIYIYIYCFRFVSVSTAIGYLHRWRRTALLAWPDRSWQRHPATKHGCTLVNLLIIRHLDLYEKLACQSHYTASSKGIYGFSSDPQRPCSAGQCSVVGLLQSLILFSVQPANETIFLSVAIICSRYSAVFQCPPGIIGLGADAVKIEVRVCNLVFTSSIELKNDFPFVFGLLINYAYIGEKVLD